MRAYLESFVSRKLEHDAALRSHGRPFPANGKQSVHQYFVPSTGQAKHQFRRRANHTIDTHCEEQFHKTKRHCGFK